MKLFVLPVGTLEIEGLSDYQEVVKRNFEEFMQERQFNANQIRFLRAVQNVFLQKRRLEVADLYEYPLARFGEDAVEGWFDTGAGGSVDSVYRAVGSLRNGGTFCNL